MVGLAELVRKADATGSLLAIGGRSLLSIDSNPVSRDWTHVTKVDPEREKQLPLAYPLYLQHSSAVSVGGSRDVTDRNTEETFDMVTAANVPAFHEPSAAAHVTDRTRDQADFLAVPEVLNGDTEALVGKLGEGIEHVKENLAPDLIRAKLPIPLGESLEDRLADFAATWMLQDAVFEAYIIQNVDSAAAREANVTEDDLLTPEAAKRRALAADRHLQSEIVYLEYSGTFGGEEAEAILSAIDGELSRSRVWYGGGVDDRTKARRVLDAGADAVVVGNIFHEIASEEADLLAVAREDLDGDPSVEAVRDWLGSEVDVAETEAASYLSTIPDVPDPEDRAERYLAEGISLGLELGDVAAGLDEPDVEAIEAALAGESVPGETAFVDALGGDARPVAREIGLALLAERFDVDREDGFAAHHLGVAL